jgi:hypothetical protein
MGHACFEPLRPVAARAGASALAVSLALSLLGCAIDVGSSPEGVGERSSALAASAPDLSNYAMVPGGDMIDQSCGHGVPSGSTVRTDADGTIHSTAPDGTQTVFPPCAHPAVLARPTASSAATT